MRWAPLFLMILGGCEQNCSCIQSHPPADEPAADAGAALSVDADVPDGPLQVPHIPGSVLRDLRRQRDSKPFGDKPAKPELAIPDAEANPRSGESGRQPEGP